jgi:ABC-type proline/glycine betaine transport system permease subunit
LNERNTLAQIVNAFIVNNGLSRAIFIGTSILNVPIEIVVGVFLVAVAAAVVALILALVGIRKQERRYQKER